MGPSHNIAGSDTGCTPWCGILSKRFIDYDCGISWDCDCACRRTTETNEPITISKIKITNTNERFLSFDFAKWMHKARMSYATHTHTQQYHIIGMIFDWFIYIHVCGMNTRMFVCDRMDPTNCTPFPFRHAMRWQQTRHSCTDFNIIYACAKHENLLNNSNKFCAGDDDDDVDGRSHPDSWHIRASSRQDVYYSTSYISPPDAAIVTAATIFSVRCSIAKQLIEY